MSAHAADTHSLVWYLFDPKQLSAYASAALTAADQAGELYFSIITLVELDYLDGRASFPYPGALGRVLTLLAQPLTSLKPLPLSLGVTAALAQVPKAEVPDMPDRIIAATAVAHRLPLVSADRKIRASATLAQHVRVIW
jgi:PIN domain nuclease of toxin-antitoxin system